MPLERQHVEHRDRPHRGPVYLSAFVYPGAGQLMQKRWAAGLLLAAAFTVCLLGSVVFVVWILVAYYAVGLQFDSYEERDLPRLSALLFGAATAFIYLINLFDAYRGVRRAGSEWARDRLRKRCANAGQRG